MNTTSEVRKILVESLNAARNGNLSGDALRGVIGCANQISLSISSEMKYRAQMMKEGQKIKAFGEMGVFK